jgi:hypothetical protein
MVLVLAVGLEVRRGPNRKGLSKTQSLSID